MSLASEPVVDDGLLMATIDRLLVVRIDDRLTPQAFDRYRTEWVRSIDARPPGAHVGAFYEIPAWMGLKAKQRSEWAAMLKSREQTLRRTTAAMTLVTPSVIARGALRAIYWLAPPPFPYLVEDERALAFDFHAKHLPGLDARAVAGSYADLVRRHVPPPSQPR